MNQKKIIKAKYKSNVAKEIKVKKDIKKVGIFTGVAFIISSVIGVGIFLKNGQIISFNLGNFSLTIMSWILTSVAVLALALSLLVISTKTNSELGILQWAKDFLSPSLFEAIKFYFIFLYIPLIVCGDSFYFLQSLQQAFPSWHLHWFYAWLIIFCVITYFLLINTLKPKMVIVHANIAFYIKLVPIVFFAFIAFILYFTNYDNIKGHSVQLYGFNSDDFIKLSQSNINSLFYKDPVLLYGPEIGFFLSIPAIFFGFDGFYYVVSIKNHLKEPKHSSLIIVLGVTSIAIISILVTLSLLLSTNVYDSNRGSMPGVWYLTKKNGWFVINSILNICVCIGCLGITSSSINFSMTLYKELIKTNDVPFSHIIRTKTNWSNKTISKIYLFGYLLVFFLLICFIGTFGFLNLDSYNFGFTTNAKINNLYSFINTITNWESLFTFTTFIFIVIGSWTAIYYKKITFKKKYKRNIFLLQSGFAIFLIFLAFVFSVYHVCGNLAFNLDHNYFYDKNSVFYNVDNLNNTQIELSNYQIYEAYIQNDKIMWVNTSNNKLLTNNVNLNIINVSNSLNEINPNLLVLILNLIYSTNESSDTFNIDSSILLNLSELKLYITGVDNSIYTNLSQYFIGNIINFIILWAIIFSCITYSLVNKINKLKDNTWFKINNNIFHNEELEIHV